MKHEYLNKEDYYDTISVGTKARTDKTCEHCGENIPKGEPHEVSTFYPEFSRFATHIKYTEAFKESLN